ncbi:hypothetical protein L3Q82_001955 [Scortum barcoo]|uniref:Uncharacterized protein n=1 Tax=Scortum barcoo TaxID=214431 RepID=A0ACB8W1J6_9TELE|nr:hypothetical protein L3Q82_001955 [Scortum barcoo]
MGVGSHLVAWITDYLTGRPQYVRLGDCRSDTVASSTGAHRRELCSLSVLFTLYTSDFQYKSEFCHVQKFARRHSHIVGCIRSGQEDEYRELIKDFVTWCDLNHLLLNTTKTREMVVDFRRPRPHHPEPVIIKGDCVEVVHTYKYLGVQLDDKLDWTANTDALCRKGQSRLYFLRRLASFNICKKLLQIFYQSVVASALLYAVVCWGGSLKKKDAARLDKLVRKAGSVVGTELDSLTSVAERRTLNRLLSIIDNPSHPLHSAISRQRSSFSDRLLSLSCSTDRLRLRSSSKSFDTVKNLHPAATHPTIQTEAFLMLQNSPLKVVVPTESVSSYLGDTALLRCEVSGDPTPIIRWQKNREDLPLIFELRLPLGGATVWLAAAKSKIQLNLNKPTRDFLTNTSKTKEVIVYYRRSRRTEHAPLSHPKGKQLSVSNNIKFLGIHITSDLIWSMNTAHLVKKAQQRLFFLRKLKRAAGLSPQLLTNFKLLQGHNTIERASSASVQQCGMAAALHKTKRT